MKNYFLFVAIFLSTVICVAAQTDAANDWSRLESDSKDFSVSVPQGFQVIAEEDYDVGRLISRYPPQSKKVSFQDIKRITAYADGASFLVESYRVNKLDDALEDFYAKQRKENLRDFSANSFQGRISTQQNGVSYAMDVIFGSKDRMYRIFGVARSEENEAFKYFFSSIKLGGQPVFVLDSTLAGKIKEQAVSIKSLEETRFEYEEGGKSDAKVPDPDRKLPVVIGVRPPEDPSRIFLAYKPLARYTTSARRSRVSGRVSLRVTFGANGQIEKIVEVNGLSSGLTEQAVKAARLIRFLPELKDNKPVTVQKTIEYSFQVY